jgi:hypothetical protein
MVDVRKLLGFCTIATTVSHILNIRVEINVSEKRSPFEPCRSLNLASIAAAAPKQRFNVLIHVLRGEG